VTSRIKVIMPVSSEEFFAPQVALREQVGTAETEIVVVGLPGGPPSIEDEAAVLEAAPLVVEEVRKSEDQGFQAVTIDCALEPGLRAAKAATNLPVIGAAEAALALAGICGDLFGWITPNRKGVSATLVRIREKGYWIRMAGIRPMDLHVLELDQTDVVLAQLIHVGKQLLLDGADVMILGCTGMGHMATSLADVIGIPVIDAGSAAIKLAEAAIGAAAMKG